MVLPCQVSSCPVRRRSFPVLRRWLRPAKRQMVRSFRRCLAHIRLLKRKSAQASNLLRLISIAVSRWRRLESIGSTGRCSIVVEPDTAPPVISRNNLKDVAMSILKWALIFFLISVVAGVFGFTGLSAASADIARVLFYIFGVIFLILLILGFTIFRA